MIHNFVESSVEFFDMNIDREMTEDDVPLIEGVNLNFSDDEGS